MSKGSIGRAPDRPTPPKCGASIPSFPILRDRPTQPSPDTNWSVQKRDETMASRGLAQPGQPRLHSVARPTEKALTGGVHQRERLQRHVGAHVERPR
eukprot:9471025-Pyramimonas_sp.AAC.1